MDTIEYLMLFYSFHGLEIDIITCNFQKKCIIYYLEHLSPEKDYVCDIIWNRQKGVVRNVILICSSMRQLFFLLVL